MTKAGSVAVEHLTPDAKGLISRLLGPAVDEIGDMLREMIVVRRQKNFYRIATKAAAMVVEGAPTPIALSTRTAVALLYQASLEDEGAGLENQWAGLLASAATGTSVPSAYPSILSQMTPLDACVLNALDSAQRDRLDEARQTIAALGQTSGLSGGVLMEAVDNLLRLRLCVITTAENDDVISRSHFWPVDKSVLQMTVLGTNFLKACRGPSHGSSEAA